MSFFGDALQPKADLFSFYLLWRDFVSNSAERSGTIQWSGVLPPWCPSPFLFQRLLKVPKEAELRVTARWCYVFRRLLRGAKTGGQSPQEASREAAGDAYEAASNGRSLICVLFNQNFVYLSRENNITLKKKRAQIKSLLIKIPKKWQLKKLAHDEELKEIKLFPFQFKINRLQITYQEKVQSMHTSHIQVVHLNAVFFSSIFTITNYEYRNMLTGQKT